MARKKAEPKLELPPVSLVDIQTLAHYEQYCGTHERLILDAESARDLLLDCWAADGEGRTSRARVRVWLGGIEKAGAVDMPAEDVLKICSTIREATDCG